ncbi:hypothetical protein F1640_18545 [Novosphingobium sp. NBM11]|uniref:hypothetical protein n=1 Tax=Novosphingobium sp. NBM11 TaxID=2596914 RepID=UPI00189251B9|nr:hypothetical protein [Novosphingobium sp. NBM11]MBF5091955.1 hypothetical protein [Novosphingobium sp. NBM11]
MGWKAIKDHYRIGHMVHVRDGLICIGSPFIPDIITLNPFGQFVKRYDPGRGWPQNDDLARYMAEIEADPEKCRELAQAEDVFATTIPVYTYDENSIIECACEELGYPNVTHDGRLMYDNTFSPDRAEVVRWAVRSARGRVSIYAERVADETRTLSDLSNMLGQAVKNYHTLLENEAADA